MVRPLDDRLHQPRQDAVLKAVPLSDDSAEDAEFMNLGMQPCMVCASLLLFVFGSLLCIAFANMFHLTYFELLYSIIAADDPDEPWPASGQYFVFGVMMLGTVTTIAGGCGYASVRMERRAVLCVFSAVCLILSSFYFFLFVHMHRIKDTVDVAVSAQVRELCNATTEWAYAAHFNCTIHGLPQDLRHQAENLIGHNCPKCQKHLKFLLWLERRHGVNKCQVLEHLCHHTTFRSIGMGRCLADEHGKGRVVPPVIKSKKVHDLSAENVVDCCELGCASVVGCAGFWYHEGVCNLVSPHQPFFRHTLKAYHGYCESMEWDRHSVDQDEIHFFVPDEPGVFATDDGEDTVCWTKGKPKMIQTFDVTATITIVSSMLAMCISVLAGCCAYRYHYSLAQQKFPGLRRQPLMLLRKMCCVFCETGLRRRRANSARERDEFLGLDYSSDEWSSE